MSATMNTGFDFSAKSPVRGASFLALALLCASCTTAPESDKNQPDQIAISNLSYGPLCGADAAPTVCGPSNDIRVTGEGHCAYGKQEMACTWYGFSFDYVPTGSPVELDCVATSDVARDYVNIYGVQATNVTSEPYKLTLDGSGHIFHSQYSGWSPNAKGDENLKQVCSFKGTKVFEVDFHLHYVPGNPAGGAS